jgi:HD-GYP domain-containing protein (c-di-GMP phosphodiesterase class II)
MIKKVRIEDLKLGMYVIIPGSWMSHPLPLNHFKLKSRHQIQEIKECGIHELEVDLSKSDLPSVPQPKKPSQTSIMDGPNAGHTPPKPEKPPIKWTPETLVPPELGAVLANKVMSPNAKSKAVYQHSLQMMSRLLESPTAENIKAGKGAIKSITDLILRDDETAHNMLLITSHDFYTYTHSVNVGITSIMLAKTLFRHSDNHDLEELGAGFFLHDLGKINIDPGIINKPGKLTEEEMNQMRTHPYQGYKILKEANALSEECEYIVLQHHERYDGTGYPKRLKGDETHIYGRICCLADVFDALTAERSYKKSMSKFDALKLMRDEMQNFFSRDLLEPFILLFK